VRRGVRLLDNVIDLNYYPTPEAKKSNLAHRPIGLGKMGWHDLLHKKKIPFDSDEAVSLASEVQEFISYHAIMASAELAAERGHYSTYDGSLWSQGKLPIDTYAELKFHRTHPNALVLDLAPGMDWKPVREAVAKHGMRNGSVMAIAPTATISFIVGCSQSIEPNYSVLFVYSTLSGDFTMVNEFFVSEMKAMGLWDEDFVKKLQAVDGDVSKIVLPAHLKERFKTAFDVNQFKLIDAGAARQKWIDQGESLNLYYAGNSMKELSDMYFHAWETGLKTTYYLHTRAASKVEKSVSSEPVVCKIGEVCESCQ
jgi:ribonucleoside-diphosphate reductase alpha chain